MEMERYHVFYPTWHAGYGRFDRFVDAYIVDSSDVDAFSNFKLIPDNHKVCAFTIDTHTGLY